MARKGTSNSLKRFDVAPEYLYPITQHHLIHGMKHLDVANRRKAEIRGYEEEEANFNKLPKEEKAKARRGWDGEYRQYQKREYKENLEDYKMYKQDAHNLLTGKTIQGNWTTPGHFSDIALDGHYQDYKLDQKRKRLINEGVTVGELVKELGLDENAYEETHDGHSQSLYVYHEGHGNIEWNQRVHKHITGKKEKHNYNRSVPNYVQYALPSREPTSADGGTYHTPYAADYRGFINSRYEAAKANKKLPTMEQYVDKNIDKQAVTADWKQRTKDWEDTHDWPDKSKKKPKPSPTKVKKPKAEKPKAPSKPLSKTQFGGDWGAEQLELF